MKVFGYLFFYLILLVTILMGFAFFGHIYYGNRIYEFSSLSRTLISLVGWMLGTDNILDNMLKKDETVTFIFVMAFLIIVTCVLLNMFWVFTKNELEIYSE